MDRRSVLTGLAIAPLAKLVGCSSSAKQVPIDTHPGDGDLCGAPAPAWASGGTAAMTAKACYPDPFAGATSCTLVCATTAGPCTAPVIERRDISDAMPGLPMRVALKIVTAGAACTPVAGAVVELWHTQRAGVYSDATPSTACNGDDPDARSRSYFRGTQTTDASGRVDFDSCFPGWYPGRCVHLHVRVTVGGTDHLVTQLVFADGLVQEIFGTHADYKRYGQPGTLNTNDQFFGSLGELAPYVCDTARMSDGVMLASKVIGIRASTADPLCDF